MKKVIVVNFILFTALFLLLAGVTLARKPIHFGDGWYTNLNGSGTAATFHSGSFCSTSGGSCTGPGANTVVRWECGGEQIECQQENENWGSSQSLGNPGCGNTVQLDVFGHYCRDGGPGTWSCGAPSDYMVWYSGDCAPPPPPPPPPTVTIGGRVTNTSGQSLSGVTISIYNDRTKNTQTVNTNSTGDFSLPSTDPNAVSSGDAYAVRPPSTPPLQYQHPPSPSSYENQTAGGTPDCGTSCNFIYTRLTQQLEASCSPTSTTANVGDNVAWTSTRTGGTSPFTYTWNFGSDYTCVTPSSNCTTTQNPTVKYNSTGSRNVTVTVSDSSTPTPQTATSSTCSATINPVGSLIVNTSSACNAANTAQTISASWNNIGAASYQPDLKDAGTSVGGINCVSGSTTSFNFPGTYSLTGSYTAYVTAFSGANCVGIITTASKNVTNAVCTTASPSPSPSPVSGDTCEGSAESCSSSINAGCSATTSAKNVWCQTKFGQTYCQYCPPPSPSNSCSPDPAVPPNNGPTIKLEPDGHTVTLEYRHPGKGGNCTQECDECATICDDPAINGDISRSTERGFASTAGSLISTQFGNHSPSFDQDTGDTRRILYYQMVANNGQIQSPSQTVAILTSSKKNRSCSTAKVYPNHLKDVSLQIVSTTTNSITFDIFYGIEGPGGAVDCGSICGDDGDTTPTHIQITGNQSAHPGYVAWASGTQTLIQSCAYTSYGDCNGTKWKRRFTIGLPPSTSDAYTITAYNDAHPYCPVSLGPLTFAASTQSGSATAIVSPQIAVSPETDQKGNPYAEVSFSPTSLGHLLNLYKLNNDAYYLRWPDGTRLSTARIPYGRNGYLLRATEDLQSIPKGTYYYGAELDLSNLTACDRDRYVKSDQTAFDWQGFTLPWIKTTGGDVHSNTGINTPGGP